MRITATRVAMLLSVVLVVGCGEATDGWDDPGERQAQAAYDCMPKPVQKQYDVLGDRFDKQLDRIYDKNSDATMGEIRADPLAGPVVAQMDGMVARYAPRVGEECK